MSRRVPLLCALTGLAFGCGASAPNAPPSRALAARASVAAAAGPARYLAPPFDEPIERTDDGRTLGVIGGARVALRAGVVTEARRDAATLVGGAAMPPWLSGATSPIRYVFWTNAEIVGAQTFFGDLTPLGTLPDAPYRAFPWTTGLGLGTPSGLFVVPADGSAPRRFPVPLAVDASAASASLGALLTRFGHASITLDGRTFRDVSAEVGGASALVARSADVAFALPDGRSRRLRSDGTFEEREVFASARAGEGDLWPTEAPWPSAVALVRGGVPMGDGRVLIAAGRFYGAFEPASGRVVTVGEAPLEDAECQPFRAPDALLLLCDSPAASVVVDVTGAPRIERTFTAGAAPPLHRFVGVDDEGLGFLGPCTGEWNGLPLDGISAASTFAGSPARSPVFCMRRTGGHWSEHHVSAEDAPFVIAWAPSFAGAAVALVGLPRPFIEANARVSVAGETRVVRFARDEPPLVLPRYLPYSELSVLSRDFVAAADGTTYAWMSTASYVGGPTAVRFDVDGRPAILGAPSRAFGAIPAGRFAIAATEDGRLFETVDHGLHFREIALPPGGGPARPEVCSPAGCWLGGGFIRLGWDGDAKDALLPRPEEAAKARAAAERERMTFTTFRPAEPVLELGCRFMGEPSGASTPGSWSFGAGPLLLPQQVVPSRLGSVGSILLPGSPGGSLVMGGDAELGWIDAFDGAAKIRRKTLRIDGLVEDLTPRAYELGLGLVLLADGAVALFAQGPSEGCLAELLDAAGVTGGETECLDEVTLGVELAETTLFVGDRDDHLALATGPRREGSLRAVRGESEPRALPPIPVLAPHRPREMGLGRLGAGAVLIAVEGDGRAVALSIDATTGALGEERAMASLADAWLGTDPRCAAKDPAEATVLLPFDREIGLVPGALAGVGSTDMPGLARLRWSPSRVCLDAVEIAVRDERNDPDLGTADPPGVLRKLIVASDPKTRAFVGTLVLIGMGVEMRQPVRCDVARSAATK